MAGVRPSGSGHKAGPYPGQGACSSQGHSHALIHHPRDLLDTPLYLSHTFWGCGRKPSAQKTSAQMWDNVQTPHGSQPGTDFFSHRYYNERMLNTMTLFEALPCQPQLISKRLARGKLPLLLKSGVDCSARPEPETCKGSR